MANKSSLLHTLNLKGLEIAPSQVWGAVRIVPLLRHQVRNDLRLMRRNYQEDLSIVSLDSKGDRGMKYVSYVPHALVLSWSNDGSSVATLGGQLLKQDGKSLNYGCASVRLTHRMAKRGADNQLRFLPLHLAMEGFLSLFFSGPNIAWSEYSRYALSYGLGMRSETAVAGRAISGLEDALRVFEIHDRQVGVLVFVAEALASAFVVPTPEDYRSLHNSLIEDFYGELLYQYGLLYANAFPMDVSVDEANIQTLSQLRAAVTQMRSDWASFQGFMAEGLLRELQFQVVYSAGSFLLQRFITNLQLGAENHIGEAIVRDNGEIEYLKTYRLSAAQTRRVYLLSQLANYNWNLEATATVNDSSYEDFIYRLEKAGFGYLINNQVREAARAKTRKQKKK